MVMVMIVTSAMISMIMIMTLDAALIWSTFVCKDTHRCTQVCFLVMFWLQTFCFGSSRVASVQMLQRLQTSQLLPPKLQLLHSTCTALHKNVVKNKVCGPMCSDLVCSAFCNSMCSCNSDGNLLCSHTSQKALFLRVLVQIQTSKCRSHRLHFKSFFCAMHTVR